MTRNLNDAELENVCGGVDRMALNAAHGADGSCASCWKPADDADDNSNAKML